MGEARLSEQALVDQPSSNPPAASSRAMRGDLAAVYLKRAASLAQQGDLQAAVRDYDRALDALDTLVYEDGDNDRRTDLVRARHARGAALSELGRFEEAAQDFDHAIEVCERLIIADGRNDLRDELAASYHARGNALSELDRLDESIRDHERALEIRDYAEGGSRKMPRLGSPSPTRPAGSRPAPGAAPRPRQQPQQPPATQRVQVERLRQAEPAPRRADRQDAFSGPPSYLLPQRAYRHQPAPPVGEEYSTPRSSRRWNKYIIVTRDQGLGLTNRFWVSTDDLQDEIHQLRSGGLRILKVVPVWSYFAKRAAAAAVVLLAAGIGIFMAMHEPDPTSLTGGDPITRTADADDGNGAGPNVQADPFSPPARKAAASDDALDTESRTALANELGRKLKTPTDSTKRSDGAQAKADGAEGEGEAASVDIFDLIDPNYVPPGSRDN